MSTLNISNAVISNSIITTTLSVNGNFNTDTLSIGSVVIANQSPLVGYNYSTDTASPGLTRKYYTSGNWNGDTTFFSTNTATSTTNNVIDINASVPGTDNSTDSFSGYFYANSTGQYQFYINCDDICTIWIGANAVSYTNTNYLVSATYSGDASANVSLVNDTYYPIFIATGGAGGPNYMNIGITGPTYANTTSFANIFSSSGSVATPVYGPNTVPTINIGSTSVNSSVIKVPSFYISGTPIGGVSGYAAIVNTQIFTANGTWTNPYNDVTNPIQSSLSGNEQVFIMMWGAGGNGSTTSTYGGGGGGACAIGTYRLADLASSVTTIVGIANGGSTSGSSVFSSLIAYAGTNGTAAGGGGGGLMGTSGTSTGGVPLGGATGSTPGVSTFGGGGGQSTSGTGSSGGYSIFGGGGGGSNFHAGGGSIFGAAGGAGSGGGQGTSIFGGAGGDYDNDANGVVPGGGGSGGNLGYAGSGARGEVRVWVIK